MNKEHKKTIKNYQCQGCMIGYDTSCFEENLTGGIGCGKHTAGTYIGGIGKVILGLPKGFCRVGKFDGDLIPSIFEKFEDSGWDYSKWNIPVWKHLNKEGHTLIRGISPRVNSPFIHIFLENCLDKINCLEITEEDINGMD